MLPEDLRQRIENAAARARALETRAKPTFDRLVDLGHGEGRRGDVYRDLRSQVALAASYSALLTGDEDARFDVVRDTSARLQSAKMKGVGEDAEAEMTREVRQIRETVIARDVGGPLVHAERFVALAESAADLAAQLLSELLALDPTSESSDVDDEDGPEI